VRFWAIEGASTHLPSVGKTRLHKVLFINKNKCAAKSRVHSITGSALKRKLACIRSFDMRLTAKSCMFDRVLCVQPHCFRSHDVRSIARNYFRIPTAQVLKQWRLGLARAMWGLQLTWLTLDRGSCIRSQCARSHQVRSSALAGAKIPTLLNFSLLSHNLHQGPTIH
jgi:hypothetical protein